VTADRIRRKLRAHADPRTAAVLQRFFKTGAGEYGEGDVFIGVKVPHVRAVCRDCRGASLEEILVLLRSPVHEERLLALVMLVDAFKRGRRADRRRIYDAYRANTRYINNWDLVDASAEHIVGAWLAQTRRAPFKTLTQLARSSSVWERRIAMIATFHWIKRGDLDETFRIADLLLHDRHHLIHKAVGWLLREAGKRDGVAERAFLRDRFQTMPRTMLRYAIERFPPDERSVYMRRGGASTTAATAAIRSDARSTSRSAPGRPGLRQKPK
jgi:3-methyladenine DNA glycosylase AlkD